ncbi:hypothetical protein K466DRAFT_129457 [Polyporus arcularius HHB13444]|uniref:Uncharacterized protein n=1 Tax=Polyporus arcularius HHB13444 TaxID=1314778 RepID=A0A5C3PX51_9APHY|nr:hypothetical protein K466DRAFT_129457 [Polyporus arcularius HHB13444]
MRRFQSQASKLACLFGAQGFTFTSCTAVSPKLVELSIGTLLRPPQRHSDAFYPSFPGLKCSRQSTAKNRGDSTTAGHGG